MSQLACPICYEGLEIRVTSPCFICGCWHDPHTLQNAIEKNDFAVYALPNDRTLVLCKLCYLEEVLSNISGFLERLRIRREDAEASVRFLEPAESVVSYDKYCVACNQRLALLKLIKTTNEI